MVIASSEKKNSQELLNSFVSKRRFSKIQSRLVYLSYVIDEDNVTIFENGADPDDSNDFTTVRIARIAYIESKDCWRINFNNEDGDWEVILEEDPKVSNFEEALRLIHEVTKSRYQ